MYSSLAITQGSISLNICIRKNFRLLQAISKMERPKARASQVLRSELSLKHGQRNGKRRKEGGGKGLTLRAMDSSSAGERKKSLRSESGRTMVGRKSLREQSLLSSCFFFYYYFFFCCCCRCRTRSISPRSHGTLDRGLVEGRSFHGGISLSLSLSPSVARRCSVYLFTLFYLYIGTYHLESYRRRSWLFHMMEAWF